MFKFLLIIFIIIYVIYKVSTFLIKTFIGQTLKRSKKNTKTKNKGILDEEGDFIDYEEVD